MGETIGIPVYVRRSMSRLHVGMLVTCWLGNLAGQFAGDDLLRLTWATLGIAVLVLHYETRDVQIGTVGKEHAP